MNERIKMPPAPRPAHGYKIALALLVGAALLGMTATMVLSALHASPVTDRDYYENGLSYGRTQSGAGNPGLTWGMSVSLAENELTVRVHDEWGAAVAGGTLTLQPEQDGASALRLNETAPGLFRAPWPGQDRDRLQATLRFMKGEAAVERKVVFFR